MRGSTQQVMRNASGSDENLGRYRLPEFRARRSATRSILFSAQTHPDKELIVVDGASTDRTLSIVASFPGENVVVYLRTRSRHLRRHEQGPGDCSRATASASSIPTIDSRTRKRWQGSPTRHRGGHRFRQPGFRQGPRQAEGDPPLARHRPSKGAFAGMDAGPSDVLR